MPIRSTPPPLLNPTGLGKSLAHFARPSGGDLLQRTERFFAWQEERRRAGLWPYSRALEGRPSTRTSIADEQGRASRGINFASQDYLSLSVHPEIVEVAIAAVRDFGTHSAGSPMLLGNTSASLELERDLAATLETEHVVLFPTGWAAGFGTIVGLVRPSDHIVMDQLAHASLQQGAFAATRSVHRHAHLDAEAVREIIHGIRSKDCKSAILVITESLFSMDSDSPEIASLQLMCRDYEATLMVDAAHDFSAMGPAGTGHLGTQGMLGKVDLVMGSFSKTFASNGGYLATHSEAAKQYVKCFGGPHIFSNALSPVQAAVVKKALSIVRSPEGERRRALLLQAVQRLREGFLRRGISCIGDPSPIVPVPVGREQVARIASALINARGLLANLVEYPAVSTGSARFRMQLMADHGTGDIEEAVPIVADAIAEANSLYDEWGLSSADGVDFR